LRRIPTAFIDHFPLSFYIIDYREGIRDTRTEGKKHASGVTAHLLRSHLELGPRFIFIYFCISVICNEGGRHKPNVPKVKHACTLAATAFRSVEMDGGYLDARILFAIGDLATSSAVMGSCSPLFVRALLYPPDGKTSALSV
jgi:hypothetical protein